VAHELQHVGYHNARALRGGWKAWIDAGLPVEPKVPQAGAFE
jgi:3-mercaptopyruvate sulfurtransferase SseA